MQTQTPAGICGVAHAFLDHVVPLKASERDSLRILQTIKGRPVSAVIALDFWCKSCIMDLGPKDEVIISLYRFNEATTLVLPSFFYSLVSFLPQFVLYGR